MKDINIEINVCDSTGKATCTVHPPIQVNPHTCCHSDHGGTQEPGVSGVASVFGRTGVVTAQVGDYTADQITETATRKFATPDEKAAWNAKQDALISGTTIRTLFGQSLLGSGDVSPTPAQMGVAAADHSHTTTEITDYTQKTKQLIHSSLEAGAGVTLSYNPVNEKTIISAAGGSGSGGSGYIVADRQGATAGQNHAFSIRSQNTFNLAAYALKEEAGAANQTYVVDDFNASSKENYDATDDVIFDGGVHQDSSVYSEMLEQIGGFYSSEVKDGYHSVDISVVTDSIIPKMTSDNVPTGYIASASSYNTAAYNAYYSFDGVTETNQKAWISNARPTEQAPQWLRIDLPNKLPVSGYTIFSRFIDSYGNNVASVRDFIFQGSDDGIDWHDLHKVTNDTRNDTRVIKSFKLDEVVAYQHYRLFITSVNGTQNFVVIAELKLSPPESKFVMRYADKFYTVVNGKLSEITDTVTPELIDEIGVLSASLSGDDAKNVAIVSNNRALIKYVYKSMPQIIIQKSPLSTTDWAQINAATLTQTGNGKVRIAVTRDLVNWHVLRNGAWVDIGALSADTAGATALIADGMTPAELGGITAAQWTQLFSANNGVPDSLA
ncbi:discoidin domain-containing protein, partial [Pectobacterium jejuense]|uniref:discoidin domain-containing protein n=1 Tax=Pectobacterium jejuense TaxID=2974022 RepID=UPI0038289FF1